MSGPALFYCCTPRGILPITYLILKGSIMQTTPLNLTTKKQYRTADRRNWLWSAIAAEFHTIAPRVDQSYVDQQAIRDKVDRICRKGCVPHATPFLLLCLYLEWRGHFLTKHAAVWVDNADISLKMPDIKIDGRDLEEDDFESGEFAGLGKVTCLTYPGCVASVGDVVNLADIVASARAYAFPVGMDVLSELQADHAMPLGKIDYLAWAQIMKIRLFELVSSGQKLANAIGLPHQHVSCSSSIFTLEGTVCQWAESLFGAAADAMI